MRPAELAAASLAWVLFLAGLGAVPDDPTAPQVGSQGHVFVDDSLIAKREGCHPVAAPRHAGCRSGSGAGKALGGHSGSMSTGRFTTTLSAGSSRCGTTATSDPGMRSSIRR